MLDRYGVFQRKPVWNWIFLLVTLIALVLMAIAVASVNPSPRTTGDKLYLTAAPNNLDWRVDASPPRLHRGESLDSEALRADSDRLRSTPLRVRVGLYAMNNYGIDMQVPSFHSTGYIWFRWDQKLQDYLEGKGLDIWRAIAPVNLLNLPNGSDWVFEPIGDGKPVRLADGTYRQTMAYKGEFFTDMTDFARHPFTRISLPIILEANDDNLDYGRLRLLPDIRSSGVGEFINSNTGWIQDSWSIAEYRHHYSTNYGEPEDGLPDFSQLVFQVDYGTSVWHSFWKLIVPLLIVMATVVTATKLDPVHWEVRLTLPVTVLLTLVFLQQGYSSELPQLAYLTFMDVIYIVAYALTLGVFGLMLWGSRRYYKVMQLESGPQRKEALKKLRLFDDAWPSILVSVALVVVVICWFAV